MEQGLKRPHPAARLHDSVEVAPLCPEGELIVKPETGQLVKLDLWREMVAPPRVPEREGGGASRLCLEKISPR